MISCFQSSAEGKEYEDEDDNEYGGINIEKAKLILQAEDKFDLEAAKKRQKVIRGVLYYVWDPLLKEEGGVIKDMLEGRGEWNLRNKQSRKHISIFSQGRERKNE